jgi:flagellar biosynthesis regulator FlaF
MTPEQRQLIDQAVAEAARDPEFGRALRRAIDAAIPKRRSRRQPAAIDVFIAYENGGETELRAALASLSVDQLKDIVAQHRMDRSQLAMKWQTTERLIELVVAQTISRAHKGEAFTR